VACGSRKLAQLGSTPNRKNAPFIAPLTLAPVSCTAPGRRRFAGDSCRLCNRSGQPCPAGLLFCQLACLQMNCAMAQRGASAGAGRGQFRWQGAGAVRRGATWRILERAAAPPGAGQARDSASVRRRQTRRVNGMPGDQLPVHYARHAR
jgi:hypothetical protein